MNNARLGVLLLAAVTCGCYEASVPLGPPGAVAVDAAIVGTWQCAPPPEDKSDSQATLVVMPFDEAQYVAEWTEGQDTDRYRAYASRAGSQVLLNVRALEPAVKPQSWVFIRYRIDAAGRLNFAIVRDKALEGLGEREALDAIRSRAAEASLYESPITCTRTRD